MSRKFFNREGSLKCSFTGFRSLSALNGGFTLVKSFKWTKVFKWKT